MSNDPQYGRRHFLKDSILSFAKTAQEYVRHRDAPAEKQTTKPVRLDWLRPPGAVGEADFVERCTKCGDCLKACPYHSIAAHPADGLPIIFADAAPCRLCDDLPCIAACETEALLPVAGRDDIRMGLAVISTEACTADQGCHACVSQCPTTALTMDFDRMAVTVQAARCVGCGLCEYTCKTVNDRVAIRVIPARQIT
jgi:ferredoxin-type protein NapG